MKQLLQGSLVRTIIVLGLLCAALPGLSLGKASAHNQSRATPLGTPRLTITNPVFHTAPGDTACADIVIKNTTELSVTITLDSEYVNVGSGDFDIEDTLHLPLFLATGDSVTIHVCYMPTSYASSQASWIWRYVDSAGRQNEQYSEVTGIPPLCFSLTPSTGGYFDTVNVGSVLLGGYSDTWLTLKNNTIKSGTVDASIEGSSNAFDFNPAFPLPLNAGQEKSIRVRFTPANVGFFGIGLGLSMDSDCEAYDAIFGRCVQDGTDSIDINSPQHALLAFRTSNQIETKTFYFQNASQRAIRVTGVSFANGTHFSVTGITPHQLPDTLAAGDWLAVSLQFQGDTNGFYRDTLLIATENALLANGFDIQAVREPKAAVHPIPTSPLTIELQPVPFDRELSLSMHDVQIVRFEVYDLLGNAIVTLTTTGEALWNASTLPSGTYIIRASGIDANGDPFVTSKHVIKR